MHFNLFFTSNFRRNIWDSFEPQTELWTSNIWAMKYILIDMIPKYHDTFCFEKRLSTQFATIQAIHLTTAAIYPSLSKHSPFSGVCSCLTVSTRDETNTIKGTLLHPASDAARGEALMSDGQNAVCYSVHVPAEPGTRPERETRRHWQSPHVCQSAQQHGEWWRRTNHLTEGEEPDLIHENLKRTGNCPSYC